MCIFPLAVSPSNLRVIQTPTNIKLSIGGYTEITCTWGKTIVRCRASWNFVNKMNITKRISSKLLYSANNTDENKDVLVINSANVNDTGFYYCEIIIEIPFFKKLHGNGTTVIVEEKGRLARTCVCHFTRHHKDSSVWTVLCISCFSHLLPQHCESQDERGKHKEGLKDF